MTDDGLAWSIDRAVPDDVSLETITFTPRVIMEAIKKFKFNGSSSADQLPPIIFKKLVSFLAVSLFLIFASFISVGLISQESAHAIVTPIFKSRPSFLVSNHGTIFIYLKTESC